LALTLWFRCLWPTVAPYIVACAMFLQLVTKRQVVLADCTCCSTGPPACMLVSISWIGPHAGL
jgi:hypothetical protein